MKLIKLHEEWSEKGKLPNIGLCSSTPSKYRNTLGLLKPTMDDFKQLDKNGLCTNFWGSGLNAYDFWDKFVAYTPLRQTIVLLICAMHDEI